MSVSSFLLLLQKVKDDCLGFMRTVNRVTNLLLFIRSCDTSYDQSILDCVYSKIDHLTKFYVISFNITRQHLNSSNVTNFFPFSKRRLLSCSLCFFFIQIKCAIFSLITSEEKNASSIDNEKIKSNRKKYEFRKLFLICTLTWDDFIRVTVRSPDFECAKATLVLFS